jgi:hypothetical protein
MTTPTPWPPVWPTLVCTATTRPHTPVNGQVIWQSDTTTAHIYHPATGWIDLPTLPRFPVLKDHLVLGATTGIPDGQLAWESTTGVTWIYVASNQRWARIYPPVPIPAPDPEIPDIQIGRYALRTFDLKADHIYPSGHHPRSLFGHPGQPDTDWADGSCVARCNKSQDHHRCPQSPGTNCRCGIYGCLTLADLIRQYPRQTHECVTVIAVAGRTMLGDRGLRTAAAKVIAYWCRDQHKETFTNWIPQATYFADINAMLAAYEFPEHPEPLPHDSDQLDFFTSNPGIQPASAPFWTNRPSGTYAKLQPHLTAATDAGKAALKRLTDFIDNPTAPPP